MGGGMDGILRILSRATVRLSTLTWASRTATRTSTGSRISVMTMTGSSSATFFFLSSLLRRVFYYTPVPSSKHFPDII